MRMPSRAGILVMFFPPGRCSLSFGTPASGFNRSSSFKCLEPETAQTLKTTSTHSLTAETPITNMSRDSAGTATIFGDRATPGLSRLRVSKLSRRAR